MALNETGKKKISTKVLAIIIVLSLAVCFGIGTTIFFLNKNEPEQETVKKPGNRVPVTTTVKKNRYTVSVRDAAGNPVKGVLIAFYDENSEMIGLPEATNSVGNSVLNPGKKGKYGAGIVAVPFRYSLDQTVHFFEEGKTMLTINLSDNPNAYLAQIGDKKYIFEEAIKVANASQEDVVIKLIGDVYFNTITINNKAGKNITIDGQGHTLSTMAASNAIDVRQGSGSVNFKNLKVNHNDTGIFVVTNAAEGSGLKLTMSNVTIKAENDVENVYKWALINALSKVKTDIVLDNVKMTMKASGEGGTPAAFIRTGNAGDKKVVNLTMRNCVLDARNAYKRVGIVVSDDTTGTINLKNTKIYTQNNYAIRPNAMKLIYSDDCEFTSLEEKYAQTPILWPKAMIAGRPYTNLNLALDAAAKMTGNVEILLLRDATVAWADVKSENGQNITINGQGYTLTTQDKWGVFCVKMESGIFTLKNMNIVHDNLKTLITTSVNKGNVRIDLENVKITAENDVEKAYEWCLINTLSKVNHTLNLTNVDIKMKVTGKGGSGCSVIRTGNDGEKKNVNMTLKNCNIDATEALGRSGIRYINGTTGSVNLINTTIKANDNYALYPGVATVTYDNKCVFTAEAEPYKTYPVRWAQAKIGNTVYGTLKEAVTAANTSKEDVTIQVTSDFLMTANTEGYLTIKNENGKNITIEGNGHKIETAGSANVIYVNQKGGTVTFKNLDITHRNPKMLFRVGQEKVDSKNVTVKFDKVNVTADSTEAKAYEYCLINVLGVGTMNLEFTNSNIVQQTVDTNKGNVAAIIRTGNDGAAQAKTVNLKMTGCLIDASETASRAGIRFMNTTVGSIDLKNTTIKTKNGYCVIPSKAELAIDEKTVAESATEPYKTTPIMWNQAKIGSKIYGTLADAVAAANESTEDVTIEILSDFVLTASANGLITIDNAAGKNITIDGKGHTIETTGPGHVIYVNQLAGTATLKDMDINHKGTGALLRMGKSTKAGEGSTDLKVKMEKMNIHAESTSTTAYQYFLIGIYGIGNNTLEMTDVHIKEKAPTPASSANAYQGVIVNQNEGAANSRNLTLIMTGCTIDASEAPAKGGVRFLGQSTKGSITLSDTKIYTNDKFAVTNGSGRLSCRYDDKCEFKVTNYSSSVATDTSLYAAWVDGTGYKTLKEAITAANGKSANVTITLRANCTLDSASELSISTTSERNITIDGDGFKITTTGTATSNSIFKMTGTGSVTFQNMDIIHNGGNILMRTTNGTAANKIALNLKNVNITAACSSTATAVYQYAIINLEGVAETTLNMENTTVKATVSNTGHSNGAGIIRSGNPAVSKTVFITMKDCTIDATEANNRSGILCSNKNTVNLTLTGCKIDTKNKCPIYTQGNTVLKLTYDDKTTWSSKDASVTTFYYKAGSATVTETVVQSPKENMSAAITNYLSTSKLLQTK